MPPSLEAFRQRTPELTTGTIEIESFTTIEMVETTTYQPTFKLSGTYYFPESRSHPRNGRSLVELVWHTLAHGSDIFQLYTEGHGKFRNATELVNFDVPRMNPSPRIIIDGVVDRGSITTDGTEYGDSIRGGLSPTSYDLKKGDCIAVADPILWMSKILPDYHLSAETQMAFKAWNIELFPYTDIDNDARPVDPESGNGLLRSSIEQLAALGEISASKGESLTTDDLNSVKTLIHDAARELRREGASYTDDLFVVGNHVQVLAIMHERFRGIPLYRADLGRLSLSRMVATYPTAQNS